MTDGFNVLSVELRGHAARLDGLLDQLDQALDAARAVSMPAGAYGLICQFLPPAINPLEHSGIDGIEAARSAMADSATGVRDSADTYDSHDRTNEVAFGSVLDGGA